MTGTRADKPVPVTIVVAGTTDPAAWERRRVRLVDLAGTPTTLHTIQRLTRIPIHPAGTFNSSL